MYLCICTFQESISVPWNALPRRMSKLYFAMRGQSIMSCLFFFFFLFFFFLQNKNERIAHRIREEEEFSARNEKLKTTPFTDGWWTYLDSNSQGSGKLSLIKRNKKKIVKELKGRGITFILNKRDEGCIYHLITT